jgi:hypothetical protein
MPNTLENNSDQKFLKKFLMLKIIVIIDISLRKN